MRKLLFFLSVLLLLLPLNASHIISDGSLPADVLSSLASALGRETWGRKDIVLEASSYSEKVDDALILSSLMLTYSEKQVLLEFSGDGRNELLESLEGEIHNLLFYESSLYSDSDLILDYALPSSYSVDETLEYRRGTRLRATDSLGNTRAIFEVDEVFPSATLLEPVFLDSPYPGMALAKENAWKLSGSVAMGFNFPSPEITAIVSLGRTDLIYPFVPIVSVAYRYADGVSYAYGGLGLEAYVDFWRIFPRVRFTLIEEGRIGANASVLLGGSQNGFDWGAVFSIFYEHRATPEFFWRAGYQNMMGEHMLLVSLGGDF